MIYGDSITPVRCQEILQGLADKGFCSSCVVFGIGSFTYQYITRDTLGFAIKATYAETATDSINLYKDPKTGDGVKKSAKGLLHVHEDDLTGEFKLIDQVTLDMEQQGCLKTIWKDGKFLSEISLSEIRERVQKSLDSSMI